jgi:putative nucleotidyltransferase with HDIG domain
LARVVGLFQRHGIDRVLVVTGHRAGELSPVVKELGGEPVFNPDHRQGMFASLRAGLAALPPEAGAFFLLPVDIPLVRGHTLIRLLQAWTPDRERALLPTFGGQPGHPPLIAAGLAPAIEAYSGQGGLRGFWQANPGLVEQVPVADRFILCDLDRPEDHRRMLRELPGRRVPDSSECLALLREVLGLDSELVAHCRAVGAVALALARGVNAAGGSLDAQLALAGGLLHDVAKGSPGHAAAGAALLRELGFPAVAPLVGSHLEIEVAAQAPLSEAELVYLADKLVRGAKRVGLEERYAARLDSLGGSPEVREAIQRRRATARRIAARVEKALGRGLEECLAGLELSEGEGRG